MDCIFLNRHSGKKKYIITITGTGNSSNVYVTINSSAGSTKVTEAGVYEVQDGDTIDCYCKTGSYYGGSATISLNGSSVASGSYTSAAQYEYVPKTNATITLSYSSSMWMGSSSISITEN